MIPTSPVLVKVGGSLLALPDLIERLHFVLRLLSGQKALIIIGGGAAADEIRRLDECCGFAPQRAHWAAIDAMTYNSKLLSRVVGSVPMVSNRDEAQTAWKSQTAVMLDSSTFLREDQGKFSHQLPELWDVTSDSIAASVALEWPCDRILFCKSCHPVSHQLEDVCTAGQLDAYMPRLLPALRVADVQVDWLNLCADEYAIQPLQGED
jgi:5-(aminomethyl)-3-furanmethanol phosphate kinase